MGVKMLNKYLKEYCKKGIKEIPLTNMRHKRIAIDMSISYINLRVMTLCLKTCSKCWKCLGKIILYPFISLMVLLLRRK